MKGNGYSKDITTPEGRLEQLRTWCSGAFATQGPIDNFLKTKRDDLDGKTPEEYAKESLEALHHTRSIMRKYRSELIQR
jgi:hypothetical protein